MSKLFLEEEAILEYLLGDWYSAMNDFTCEADGVFSEKGKLYDRESPVWERISFPLGYVQELRKKTDRLKQLLADWKPTTPRVMGPVRWSDVKEELRDILNYARMMGAIILMLEHRSMATSQEVLAEVYTSMQDYLNEHKGDQ